MQYLIEALKNVHLIIYFLNTDDLYLSSIKVLSFFSIQYKCFKCVSKSRIAFVNFSQEHFGYLSSIDKCSKLLLLKCSVKKKTVTGMKMRYCKIGRVDFVNPIKSITQPFYKKATFFSTISDLWRQMEKFWKLRRSSFLVLIYAVVSRKDWNFGNRNGTLTIRVCCFPKRFVKVFITCHCTNNEVFH